jgi:hypothetical protein
MRLWRNIEDQVKRGALPSPFLFRCGKSAPTHLLAKKRGLGIFPPGASPEVQESSSLEFPESGLEVHCTPAPDELASLMVGLNGQAIERPHTRLSGLSLSRD